MSDVKKTQVCKCEHCGNEAEMVISCALPEESNEKPPEVETATLKTPDTQKVKGTAICSHCGNEADMWINF